MTTEQAKKRKLIGTVVSDKMQKTRVVLVARLKKHPKYLKYYKASTKLKAHDEDNAYHTGDVVTIEETRPLSKEKRWKIIGKVEKNDAKRHPEQSEGSQQADNKQ